MMFSSNQVLEISGSMRQLEAAIEFAMMYSGRAECFTRHEKPSKCVYQITYDGRYCIGWSLHDRDAPPDGWSEYPFDYDPKIISAVVQQWLEKAPKPIDEHEGFDGSHRIGFLLRECSGNRWKDWGGIKNGLHCIITLRPFWCFYAK